MFTKVGAVIVLALCLLAGQSEAQECSAESVVNLKLETSHKLTWSVRPGEPCDISEYLIYIFHPNQPAEYAFSVKETSVDVSFLEVCEEWTFVVVPVSGHTIGGQRRILANLPLPANANLTLAYMNVLHNPDTGRTRMYWDLSDRQLGNCSLRYRVTVERAGSPVIEDFYVDEKQIDLHFLSSCTAYQFGVRAINIASPTVEGPLKSATHELFGRKQYPPRLFSNEVGATWANMSFWVESVIRNPCLLRAIYIDGGSAISQTIALSNEGDRNPVNVYITNLTPSTKYDLNVYISNTAGWSNATEVSFQTLDVDLEDNNELNGEQPHEIDESD